MSASPAPESSTSFVSKPKGPATTPAKPANVFSNDGSFLERFKKSSVPPVDVEKQEREKALARKKAMEDRFKKRGKRPSTSTTTEEDGSSSKKQKSQGDDSELTAYQKEVKRLNASNLKDEGYEIRPLLK
ncbi:uncharacterized protein JCM6883_003295 [Sporobolomyces salmoneus]|uniref:uncharacterized protein n=1 Tax=Sporobolomyces salmoneus TaxID=183962 RepID=UPI00317FEDCB